MSDLEILRRIAERGLKKAQRERSDYVDLFQHMIDEVARVKSPRPAVPVEDLKRLRESANGVTLWSGDPPCSWWNYQLDALIAQAEKDHE